MPSLRQLLAAHAPLLLIDAASARVQVGWIEGVSERLNRETHPDANAGLNARWYAADDEAGVAIFRGIEALGVAIADVGAFVFCDGPGSVLGVRTAAMALRAWRVLSPKPMFAYRSLALVAHALGRDDVGVIADARRDCWHHYQIGKGLRRLPASDVALGSSELAMPEGFRHWTALPSDRVERVPYSIADLLPRAAEADLFAATDAPDAFLHEEPSYVTWTPQIHRAPGER